MKSLRLISAASCLLLAACAEPPPPFFNAVPDQTVPAPRADKAQIVFLNPSNAISGAFLAQIYEMKGDNREFLGALGPKTKMFVNVDPAGGDPQFTVDNPRFNEWLTESQLVVRTAEADAFVAKYKERIDEAQQRGWTEWQAKRPDQKAELTLNREDSVDR